MMLSPDNGPDALEILENALLSIPKRTAIDEKPPVFRSAKSVMSVREACFSASEQVCIEESAGRILAAASVGCPPAVPIVVCGERIDAHAIECFKYYGIEYCTVVRER